MPDFKETYLPKTFGKRRQRCDETEECRGRNTEETQNETLPKALRTQALTALTSNFGLVGLVQYAC